jgi:uncharacterized protein with ParB-like and HNH nuclease domain
MNFKLQTLSKLFNEKLYRIPDYQRGYAWEFKQINDFWTDLCNLEENKKHYVGVLYLDEVDRNFFKKDYKNTDWENDKWIIIDKQYEAFYIVDGQQRLTTSVILIQAILNTVEKKQIQTNETLELNHTSLEKIREKYIVEQNTSGISKSYLFGYEKDNPSYEYLKHFIFKQHSTSKYNEAEETLYTHNLQFALRFFEDELIKLDLKEIEKIYTKLTQSFLFNTFIINDEIDIYSAFETINNRGKRLSLLELMKNRLIALSVNLKVNNLEKEQLRKRIHEVWKSIYYYLGKEKDGKLNDNEFLYLHTENYFKRIDVESNLEKRLLEHIFNYKNNPKCLGLNFIDDYITDLQKSIKLWHNIHYPDLNNFSQEEIYWLKKFQRLNTSYNRIFKYYIKHTLSPVEEKVEHLIDLEDKEVISSLFSGRGEINKNWYKNAMTPYILYEYDLFLRENYKTKKGKPKTQQREVTWLNEWLPEKRKRLEKNIYLEYNAYHFVVEKIYDEDYATLEHILPQNWEKIDYWKQGFGKLDKQKVKTLINSIGNLLPLSSTQNSSVGNKSYLDKKEEYKKGSFSELEVVEKYEDWTILTILDRNLKIFDFIQKRWKSKDLENIKTTKQRLEFLGLSEFKSFIGL